MNLSTIFQRCLFAACLFFFVSSQRAEAYLDPSTGTYILELIAGAIFTLMFTAKNLVKAVKSKFAPAEKPASDMEKTD